jgi:hypothetical protein
MIEKIDISDFNEESFTIDNLEILFSEEGIFILSQDGLFTSEDFKKINKNANNFYSIINNDRDQLFLTEEQYKIIKELIDGKK